MAGDIDEVATPMSKDLEDIFCNILCLRILDYLRQESAIDHSAQEIAKNARISQQTVNKCVKRLYSDGWIIARRPTKTGVRLYRIDVDAANMSNEFLQRYNLHLKKEHVSKRIESKESFFSKRPRKKRKR